MVNFGRQKHELTPVFKEFGVMRHTFFSHSIRLAVVVAGFTLGACTTQDLGPDSIHDPLEPANRAIHQVNKGLDTVVLRPASLVYAAVLPDPVEDMVSNAASNLGEPSDALNHLLQGDVESVLVAVGRFGVNSTLGIAGLFDPATGLGMAARPTDFGETLAQWGVGEGPYLELPVFGPSTTRDAFGRVVDTLSDPVGLVANSQQADYILVTRVLDTVDQRHRYSFLVDGVLYESADSYTAARIAYLQNRRAGLKGEVDEADIEDPFAFE